MKYLLIFIILSNSNLIFSQTPQKMSYQAVIRDASHNLIAQRNIGMQISILKDDPNGKPVYIEVHLTSTNLNGLVSLQIGKGIKIIGELNLIDWSTGSYYIKTETDPDGGFDYKITGTSEVLSVPYALYAEKSKTAFDTTNIYRNISNLEKQSIENKSNILINIDSIKSSAIKIQKNIDDILLNNKNIQNNVDSLDSKISKIDLDNLLLNYQKLGKFVTAISLLGVDSFDIKINGNLTASKNVTVGGNIEALGSTSTLGTIEKPFKGLFISSGSLSIASDTLGQDIPATILSNVRGNLEISAGGLKLIGNDQAFIAPRIVSTLTGNASTATKLDTARKINGIAFDGSKDITIATTTANALTYTNTGTGDMPGGSYDGSLAKMISYNSIGASPLSGSTLITSVGTLADGAIPYTLLTGTVPIWNQSTTGNSATVTTNANLSGIVTSVGNITSIASGTITNSMLANTAVSNLSGINSGDESAISIRTKLGITTLTGSNTGDQTSITGNAGTATKLSATKLINGVAFDGSSDINITAIANAGTLSGTILNPTIVSSSLSSVGTLTNLTVTNPINGSVTGNSVTVTNNANLTGPITSSGNATSVASQTGTGSKFVMDNSPTLITPNLGLASATTLNKVAITAPTTSSTLTLIDGSSLITAGAFAITLTSTAATNLTLPTTGTLATTGTLVKISSLTSGTTFTKQASTNMLVVYVIAAGGGGGGVVAITGSGFSGAAGGGGGGEVRIVRVTAPSASAYTFALGLGGTSGDIAGGTGGTGGSTTWDVDALSATITAIGGSGGVGTTNATASTSGAGGVGGTGGIGAADASFVGFSGSAGAGGASVALGGSSGSPFGGFGAGATSFIGTTGSVAGHHGHGFGAGGSGAASLATAAGNGTANIGGVGAGGMIVVYEYK